VAPQRAAALPEVSTVAEAGLPNFEVTTWYGILAPAGTPKAIVTRLNAELVKAMHAPDLKERLAAMATDRRRARRRNSPTISSGKSRSGARSFAGPG